MTALEIPEGVGRTAIGVAGMRAAENRRPDRLFEDPYAEHFVAAARPRPPARPEDAAPELARWAAAMSAHVVLRTRFYDDYLRQACAEGGCRQVVLLAAGLDARAFRLDWPAGVRLFEVDMPEVLAFKQQVLDDHQAVPRCRRTTVATDLRGDWAPELAAAGFRPAEPSAWLVEGLLIYLTAEDAARLLTRVGELAAPGSRLSFEHRVSGGSGLLERARDIPALDRLTSLWKGGLGEDAPAWLSRHGWEPHTFDRTDLAASYGRPIGPSRGGGFLTAVRLND